MAMSDLPTARNQNVERIMLRLLAFFYILSCCCAFQNPIVYRYRQRPTSDPAIVPIVRLFSSATGENKFTGVVSGPDEATKPDYENIHGPMGKFFDTIFLSVFRTRMAEKVGVDSSLPKDDYQGLMELTSAMNARYSDRAIVQRLAQDILRSLFPSWLPGQYAILFSKPFPQFSARMNAWATRVGGTWLMGECEINDVEVDGVVYKDQGLLVKRCKFLEESGCASVCVNSCKIPTQNFFMEDMGLPLTMVPDYETHECQFKFGVTPTDQDEFEARNTPCLSRCPSLGGMRKWHQSKGQESINVPLKSDMPSAASPCQLMDNAIQNES